MQPHLLDPGWHASPRCHERTRSKARFQPSTTGTSEAYPCCTSDVQLYTPLAHFTGPYEGPAGIREFFRDIEDASPDFRLELECLEMIGDQALAFLRLHASGRISGVPLDLETANVYDFAAARSPGAETC